MKTNFFVTYERKIVNLSRRLFKPNNFFNRFVNLFSTLINLQLVIEEVKLLLKFPKYPKWIRYFMEKEKQYHLAFFGQEFDLTEFANTLKKYGKHQLKRWAKIGLEPHFLPKVAMMTNTLYPGWKVKPDPWFYERQMVGKIFYRINGQLQKVFTVTLGGETVLIDTRQLIYQNAEQMCQNDSLLSPIVKQLRQRNEILNYDVSNFCFSVSALETDIIKPLLAKKLGLSSNQVRLETVIEGNVIPQLYPDMPRKNNGEINVWVWYDDFFMTSDNHLFGCDSIFNSWTPVGWDLAYKHNDKRSFRFLSVL